MVDNQPQDPPRNTPEERISAIHESYAAQLFEEMKRIQHEQVVKAENKIVEHTSVKNTIMSGAARAQ